MCIFRLKPASGQVKHTPVEEVGNENPFHYDFYKSDRFWEKEYEVSDMLEIVEIKPI